MLCLLHRASSRVGRVCNEFIAFVFDQKPEIEFILHAIYRTVQRSAGWPRSRFLGSIGFDDRRTFVPLQAADMLAYVGAKLAACVQRVRRAHSDYICNNEFAAPASIREMRK